MNNGKPKVKTAAEAAAETAKNSSRKFVPRTNDNAKKLRDKVERSAEKIKDAKK